MLPARKPDSRNGFTLVELLIYIGIFSVVSGLVLGILNTTIKSNQAEVANNEVTTQLNTVLTDIQNQVNQSSNLEVYPSVTNLASPTSTGSFLKLRMNSSSTDPTCIYLASSTVYMAQGPDPTNASQCNQANATALTTSQVLANNLTFTQITVPGGYASVSVSLQLTYNSSNPAFAISKTVQSAISRVSSATFPSNLIPASDNTFDIGQISPNLRWRNANFAGTVTLGTGSSGGSLGIGTETPSGVLDVVASSTNSLAVASNGNVGIGTTGPYAPLNISSNVDNSASWWNIGDVGLVVANSNANGDAILKLENTVGRIVWGSGLSNDLLVFSSVYATSTTSSEVVINNAGNVGVGTSNPTYKLDVGGSVRTTGNYYDGGTQLAYPISLPETGSSAQWVKLGTLTIPQQGSSAFITVVSNEGFNASVSQNFEVYIRFKTSNANSVDVNGFCADSSYYVLGENSLFTNSGNIKWVANASGCSATAYTLYMNFGTWTGSGSFYTVQSSLGVWVNSGALGQTDPGAASATVEIPANLMSIQSNVGIGTVASANTSTPLVVNGIIDTTSGGIEFPDGTVQTTAIK